ncbi:hypothetical protein EJB05_45851 [Eragrostis curvula]|uniref:J domain-containing protein n=1 Tax=Eragrostis curvula TaxID=38414 RepID=A0A5J9TMV2_9POAL|nr:hypothetical protein EJB05_45851 [Eragrostis curvula]
MAAGHGNVQEDATGADLYAVLGLKKECTDAELRVAYRKLAMIWHPDRCSASGSSVRVEEAKERFQEIQGAYSDTHFLCAARAWSLALPRAVANVIAVLSDSNKRFLYDVGVYDTEDDEDDLSGMGDFLGEMADMMSQATPTESFEELQQLFVDMFQDDIMAGICTGPPRSCQQRAQAQSPPCTSVPPQQASSPLRPPFARAKVQTPPSSRNDFFDKRRGSSAVGSGKPSRPGRAGERDKAEAGAADVRHGRRRGEERQEAEAVDDPRRVGRRCDFAVLPAEQSVMAVDDDR